MIGFVVTTHFSERLRPNGRKLISDYLNSLNESMEMDYKVYIIDNESINKMEVSGDKYIYKYIEDQSILGITGAWNIGIKMAIDDKCDLIINTNDDIIFDSSINNFINIINGHEFNEVSLYAPVTNIGGCPGPNKQERKSIGDKILETTQNMRNYNNGHGINGFFNAFTKECFNKFQKNGCLYSIDEKYKISGQESEMQTRLGKVGLRSFIIENCMVYHHKIRGWQKLK